MAVGGETHYSKGSKVRDDGKLYKSSSLWCKHGFVKGKCKKCKEESKE